MEARFNHLVYAICNIATDLQNIDFSNNTGTTPATGDITIIDDSNVV